MLKQLMILPAVMLCISIVSLSAADAKADEVVSQSIPSAEENDDPDLDNFPPTCDVRCSSENGHTSGTNRYFCVITICLYSDQGSERICKDLTQRPFPVTKPRNSRDPSYTNAFCGKVNEFFNKWGLFGSKIPKVCRIGINDEREHNRICQIKPLKPKKGKRYQNDGIGQRLR